MHYFAIYKYREDIPATMVVAFGDDATLVSMVLKWETGFRRSG